jgi:diacylglycerol kinase (ATP)
MNQVLLLMNPQAGGRRAAGLQAQIEQSIRQQGLQVQTYLSPAAGSIRSWLASTPLDHIDAVIAAGGDGTVFETLNALMCHSSESRPPLGILPIGTGNAFSRDLGLRPGDWQSALALIVKGDIRRVDVGRVHCSDGPHYFLNIAGMGFVVDAGRTARKLKGIGRVSYTLAALWQTLRLHSHQLRLEADQLVVEQEALFVEISNSRYTGTSFLMAPEARLDDGLLDLTLLRKMPRSRLLRLFRTIYSGTHGNYPEVTVLQGRHFKIIAPVDCPLMMDGEFAGTTPADITCLPGELRIFG